MLGGPEDGVYRAGLDALGAADAFIFTNDCDTLGLFNAVFCIQGLGFYVQQVCQGLDGAFAAWRALVDGFAVGYGFGRSEERRVGKGCMSRVWTSACRRKRS